MSMGGGGVDRICKRETEIIGTKLTNLVFTCKA